MILSEFLKGRNVKINAVSNYISRNPDKFEGHVKHEGKNTILDDEAIRILDEKYPLLKPNVIVNGVPEEEHRDVLNRLSKAQEVIIMMQNELTDQKLLVAEKEHNLALLEDKQSRADADRERLENEVSQLKEELDKVKNRGFWERILNK